MCRWKWSNSWGPGRYSSLRTSAASSDGDSFAEQLAVGAVVGDEVWDQPVARAAQTRAADRTNILDFLPSGSAYEPLRALTIFFCGTQIEFEVQLILKREEVPPCDLGEIGGRPASGLVHLDEIGADSIAIPEIQFCC